jgi:hypothetical protein
MRITDPKMQKKFEKVLGMSNNLFNLEDIREGLQSGNMQSHAEGDTWAITQVHEWPRRKAVNILFVVGSLSNSLKLEQKIEAWAKEIGADLVTAVGRDGWWNKHTPGWKKVGTLYSKDI